MWPVFPATQTLALMGVIVALGFLATRVVQPAWSESRIVRGFAFAVIVVLLSGMTLWGLGRAVDHLGLVHAGAGIAYAGVIVLLPAAIVAPMSAALDRLVTAKVPAPSPEVPSVVPSASAPLDTKLSRREILRFGTSSLPAVAAIGSASGFVSARDAPRMPIVRMRWPDLHPDLEGLRILHLSDLHLGACFGVERLETALRAARTVLRPDLIVLTGDLADDPSLIPEALALVAGAGARYGAVASLGNHEYLHGIEVTRPKYEASAVPLLVGTGTTLRIGGARFFIGGADDPVHMGGDIPWFLRPSIHAAASAAPADTDFRLLLCHRPEGHGPAAESGFDLVLSGHTHGGQLGFLGKSLLERVRPEVGWWGTYARRRPREISEARARGDARGPAGPSRLYTTSGFGHWFPFRLGCPTEMPLVVLEGERSKASRRPGMTSLSRSDSRRRHSAS